MIKLDFLNEKGEQTSNCTDMYLSPLSTDHSLQRNARHLLAFIPPHIILTQDRAVITGDTVSAAVPKGRMQTAERLFQEFPVEDLSGMS